MSYLVRNPEDRFSCVAAHILLMSTSTEYSVLFANCVKQDIVKTLIKMYILSRVFTLLNGYSDNSF